MSLGSGTGPRIIAIGLQKTGTSSLHSAMEIVGYRSHHFPIKLLGPHWFGTGSDRDHTFSTDNLDFDAVAPYDVICDMPVCLPDVVRQLDARFPGSRFVYTLRDPDKWVRSVEKHYSRDIIDLQKSYRAEHFGGYDPTRDIYRTCDSIGLFEFAYDIPLEAPDRAEVLRAYCVNHKAFVEDYFKERPNDILYLDVAEKGAMTKLCAFLGINAPFADFPHKNAETRFSSLTPSFAKRLLTPYRRLVPERLRFVVRRWKNLILERRAQRKASAKKA